MHICGALPACDLPVVTLNLIDLGNPSENVERPALYVAVHIM